MPRATSPLMPPRRPRRPPVLRLGSYTVRPMRPGDDGTWSYRLEWYPPGEGGRQRTQGLGRHLPADVEAVAHAAISSLGSPTPTVGRGQVATWADLLGVALAAWTRRGRATGTPAPATLADYTRIVGVLAWATGPSPLPTSARARLRRRNEEIRRRASVRLAEMGRKEGAA